MDVNLRFGNGTIWDGYSYTAKTTAANGDVAYTTSEFNRNSILKGKEVITIRGDGLYIRREWDLNGSGDFGRIETELNTLNANGSTSTEIAHWESDVFTGRVVSNTSANGLNVSTHWGSTQSGAFDQSSVSLTTLNVDGTESRTVTNSKAGGVLISRFMSTLSADGRTLTVQEDNDGTSGFERTKIYETLVLADGTKVQNISTLGVAGALKAKEVSASSGDGALITTTRDNDGNGSIDQREVTTNYVDGSQSVLITSFVNNIKSNQTIISKSADGLRKVTAFDVDGNGIFEQKRISVGTFNIDGSTSYIENNYAVSFSTSTNTNTLIQTLEASTNGTLKSSRTETTSSDGRTTITQSDLNGDGVIDRTVTSTTDISDATTTTETNNLIGRSATYLLAGAVLWNGVAATSVTTESFDGLTKTVRADFDGDGSLETTTVSRTQIDGSIVSSITDSGSILSAGTGVMTISADGLTTVLLDYRPILGGMAGLGPYSITAAITRCRWNY